MLGRPYAQLPDGPRRVGSTFDGDGQPPGVTGAKALALWATMLDLPRARVGEVLDLVGLRGAERKAVSAYSTGMRQRLDLAVALLADRHGGTLRRSRERALVAEVRIGDQLVALAFPQTYVNLSGEAVAMLVRRHGITDPARVVVVEGILVLSDPQLRSELDPKIFVDTDPDLRLARRLERDIAERGRTVESVIHQYFSTVRPMHLEFVEPSRRYADLIIPEGYNSAAVATVVELIRSRLT